MKGLTFAEAFKKMVQDGEKITSSLWKRGQFLYAKNNCIIDEKGKPYLPNAPQIDRKWFILE